MKSPSHPNVTRASDGADPAPPLGSPRGLTPHNRIYARLLVFRRAALNRQICRDLVSFPHYDTMSKAIHVASDHAAIYADINL